MPESYGYILNRRPFRENSLLLDILTEDFGRISCVARPAKKRGKVLKGTLEPFRYLKLQWIGKGDVQTLTQADEHGRHNIPPSELMLGIYMNELMILLTQPHAPIPELFKAYKYTLHKISDATLNREILMRFELFLLETLGYVINNETIEATCIKTDQSEQVISNKIAYCFTLEEGLVSIDYLKKHQLQHQGLTSVSIPTELLLSLHDMTTMQDKHWVMLRQFLDKLFKLISPRVIHSRKMLKM